MPWTDESPCVSWGAVCVCVCVLHACMHTTIHLQYLVGSWCLALEFTSCLCSSWDSSDVREEAFSGLHGHRNTALAMSMAFRFRHIPITQVTIKLTVLMDSQLFFLKNKQENHFSDCYKPLVHFQTSENWILTILPNSRCF